MAAMGPVVVSAVVSYSLAYNAAGIVDNDNLATTIEYQIQISIVLIGMVRKPSIDPIVLAKQWGITPRKAKKTIQAKGIRNMLHPMLARQFRMNDCNLHYHQLAQPVSSDTMFVSAVSRRGNKGVQFYALDFDELELSQCILK